MARIEHHYAGMNEGLACAMRTRQGCAGGRAFPRKAQERSNHHHRAMDKALSACGISAEAAANRARAGVLPDRVGGSGGTGCPQPARLRECLWSRRCLRRSRCASRSSPRGKCSRHRRCRFSSRSRDAQPQKCRVCIAHPTRLHSTLTSTRRIRKCRARSAHRFRPS